MAVPKKWWWLVGVAVPITVAVIAIVPDLIRPGGGGETFSVIGTQFNDEVYFNTVSVILEQAEEAGQTLSPGVIAKSNWGP